MPSKGETVLFQSYPPRRDRCALCECRQGPFTMETRLTGRDLAPQSWPYCPSCWQASQSSEPDPVGFWRLLYAVFEYDPRRTRADVGPLEEPDEASG